MKKFFEIMEGTFGRSLRVALGGALAFLGLARMTGPSGRMRPVGGLLPIAMGLWDLASCISHLAASGESETATHRERSLALTITDYMFSINRPPCARVVPT